MSENNLYLKPTQVNLESTEPVVEFTIPKYDLTSHTSKEKFDRQQALVRSITLWRQALYNISYTD